MAETDALWADIFVSPAPPDRWTAVVGRGDSEIERRTNYVNEPAAERGMEAMWRKYAAGAAPREGAANE